MAEEQTESRPSAWIPWFPPYDPRRVEGCDVMEDAHGRLIEYANCGIRCPGCGVCCTGYRDEIAPDYEGTEEYEGNLTLKRSRGGLVKQEDGSWYRPAHCGPRCPGFERCCPPFALRDRPETIADARRILLESDTAALWAMQEALLILAHDGSAEAVEVLEAYMPRAHARLAGFAECALDEGRWWAEAPRTPEDSQRQMKREVLQNWDLRAVEAFGEIEDIEFELEQRRYEVEIARRQLDKAGDDAARETWQSQVAVLEMLLGETERRLAEKKQEMGACDAMVAEMQADLGIDPMEAISGTDEGEIPF